MKTSSSKWIQKWSAKPWRLSVFRSKVNARKRKWKSFSMCVKAEPGKTHRTKCFSILKPSCYPVANIGSTAYTSTNWQHVNYFALENCGVVKGALGSDISQRGQIQGVRRCNWQWVGDVVICWEKTWKGTARCLPCICRIGRYTCYLWGIYVMKALMTKNLITLKVNISVVFHYAKPNYLC